MIAGSAKLATSSKMAMEKMKKMFGRKHENENVDGEEKDDSQPSDGAVGGGEERRPNEPRKPRFAEPVTISPSASAKKKENKVVRVEVQVEGGSKSKPTSVKKSKSIAAPSVRFI